MPEAAKVEDKVKQIIVEQLGVDEGEVTPSASFVDDLGADSLDTVELLMAFEEAFDIEIPDEDAEKIKTVKDAVDYIAKNSKEKQPRGRISQPTTVIVSTNERSHHFAAAKSRRHRHRSHLRRRQYHRRGLEEPGCWQERHHPHHPVRRQRFCLPDRCRSQEFRSSKVRREKRDQEDG